MVASFETTIISIIIMIFLGYLLRRFNLVKTTDINSLNNIAINLTLPCLAFASVYSADLSHLSHLAILPFVNVFTTAIVGTLVYYFCKFKGYSKKITWTVILVTVTGNTAFVGYPVCFGVFGQTGLVTGIFSDMGSLIIYLLLSIILTMVLGGSAKSSFKKVLSFPLLWAVLLGLIFNIFTVPIGDVLSNVVGYMGDATIPLIMISLGVSLNFKGIKDNLNFAGLGFFTKLIFYPIVALGIITLIGLKGLEMNIALIQAAMPSGMIVLTLITEHELDLNIASVIIFTTTILSLLTLSGILFLL